MTVYIDDFKVARLVSAVKRMWKDSWCRSDTTFTPMERCLGCTQRSFETFVSRSATIGSNLPGLSKVAKPSEQKHMKVMEYDMSLFIGSLAVRGGGVLPYKHAQTPCLPEETLPTCDDQSEGALASSLS